MPLRGEHPLRDTYEILETIEEGAAGVLVRAYDNVLETVVVQKTVDRAGREDAVAFEEPWLLERLSHARIPEIRFAQHDPEHSGATTFVLPDYQEGSVEGALLRGRRFSLHESIQIIRDLLDALAYLHDDWGLIHRDIKPGNVLLEHRGERGLLIDFGSAALMEDDGMVLTARGTPLYRSPEAGQCGRFGVPGELYAVGLTLFEMLNGRFVWEELDQAQVDRRLYKGQRAVPNRLLSRYQPHVPRQLRRIVRKAIDPRHGARFKSAAQFADQLGRLRCIDWRLISGDGTVGHWIGTWPAHLPRTRRDVYHVEGRRLRGGHAAGKLRLEATRASGATGNRRRFGVSDATLDCRDVQALERFFEAVEASAAQRMPAR